MKHTCDQYPQTILVLGPSGSGKDTQIDKFIEACGGEKIGTGDMFREEYEAKTEVGIRAHDEYWGKGIWCPNDMVYELLASWIRKFDSNTRWIFSQVVREPGQIELFDDLMVKNNRKLELVVHFPLSAEAAIERMSLRRHCPKCGREYHLKYKAPKNGEVCDDDGEKLQIRGDDYPEAIKQRMEEYETKVVPVVEAYKKRGILIEVDAKPPIEEVWNLFQEGLDEWVSKQLKSK